MLSLNTDRFWTILFTIPLPLPLMLSSVAVAQKATVDPEPIRIATETTIKLAASDVGNLNFHQPKLESRVDQAQRIHPIEHSPLRIRNGLVDPAGRALAHHTLKFWLMEI